MNTTFGFGKTACAHCGGHIEFPQRDAGQMIACPHCGKEVMLVAEPRRAGPPGQAKRAAPTAPPIADTWASAALNVLGWIEVIGSIFAFVAGGPSLFLGCLAGGIVTIGLAKLVEYSHQTAQRMARIETHLQKMAEERS